jgi:hypothetical protein
MPTEAGEEQAGTGALSQLFFPAARENSGKNQIPSAIANQLYAIDQQFTSFR